VVLVKVWRFLFLALALFVAVFATFYFQPSHAGGERSGILSQASWQRMALPGDLSKAHAFLGHNCAACHTAVKGVEASSCIACHANNKSLLQRQPTAFHAGVGSCVECHSEHQGIDKRPTRMDHLALSRIGFRQLQAENLAQGENERVRKSLLDWIGQHQPVGHKSEVRSVLTPQEAVLNCASCHSNKDRHVGLLGQDCAQCHGTTKWTIPEFRHPSPTSMDCVQCHQAPPSHYMMHFKMVSMATAGVEKAEVSQCFLCHQTTSWNDIKRVGYYKHH
jgi:hypothetical protein